MQKIQYVSTIHPSSIVKITSSVPPTLSTPRKPPKAEFIEKMISTAKHSNPWQLQLLQRSMSQNRWKMGFCFQKMKIVLFSTDLA